MRDRTHLMGQPPAAAVSRHWGPLVSASAHARGPSWHHMTAAFVVAAAVSAAVRPWLDVTCCWSSGMQTLSTVAVFAGCVQSWWGL